VHQRLELLLNFRLGAGDFVVPAAVFWLDFWVLVFGL